MKGGIAPQRLVEIFGEGGTGKTQFAIQLLLNSILPTKLGGLGGKALYVFTQKHVSEKRYNEIKDHFLEQNMGNITSEEVDKKIMMMEAFKLEEYNAIFNDIDEKIKEDNIRCLIIDNIASVCDHFINVEMTGSTVDYLERASFLNKQSDLLRNIAYKYNIVVITLNNVVADMMSSKEDDNDPSKMYTEKFRGRNNASKPALGIIWSTRVNDRICLRRQQLSSTNFKRKMLVDQSPHWPHNEMEFEVVNSGIKGLAK